MFMLDAAPRLRLCERDAQGFHSQRSRSPGDVRILRKLRHASHDLAAGADFGDPEGWNAKRALTGVSQAVVAATRLRRPSHAVRNASCAGISKTRKTIQASPKVARKKAINAHGARNNSRVNPMASMAKTVASWIGKWRR